MNVVESTRVYERWLARHVPIVRADLQAKHAAMRMSAFVFLRGTFYRWAQVWPDVCGKAASAPLVDAVGDLHIENFGTWRDAEGRLVWGINDFDEACRLPYTNDLTRLATSARLAARARHLQLGPRVVCEAILEGYRKAMDTGGRPVVLAERNRWLGTLAVHQLRDPRRFWKKLDANKDATSAVPRALLRSALPEGKPDRIVARRAGVGSLGRPRFVALLQWRGGRLAREAKALVPSAAGWAVGERSKGPDAAEVMRKTVRSPDPFFAIRDGWIVRRLAPDCTKIEVDDLPRVRDEARLLRAMGWETANVHLGSRAAGVRRDLRARPDGWLERAARDMADAVTRDFRAWQRR